MFEIGIRLFYPLVELNLLFFAFGDDKKIVYLFFSFAICIHFFNGS